MRLESTRNGYLRPLPFLGSQPLYRLARNGTTGWLVTASPVERDALVTSGQFRYEGVLGHAAATQQPSTAMLWRFSNGPEWRIAFDQPHGRSIPRGGNTL